MYLLITYLCDILWLEIWMAQIFSKTSMVFRYVWYSGVSSSDPNLLKCAIHICVKFFHFYFTVTSDNISSGAFHLKCSCQGGGSVSRGHHQVVLHHVTAPEWTKLSCRRQRPAQAPPQQQLLPANHHPRDMWKCRRKFV